MTKTLDEMSKEWKSRDLKYNFERAKDDLKGNLTKTILAGAFVLGCWGFTGYSFYKVKTNSEYKQIQKEKTELTTKIDSIENICNKYVQSNDTLSYFNNLNKNVINKEKLSQLEIKENKYNMGENLGILSFLLGFFGLVPFLTNSEMHTDWYKPQRKDAERKLNEFNKNI